MARPRKTQETEPKAPTIVDTEEVVFSIEEDEPEFDLDEETFSDADIQKAAEAILHEANVHPSANVSTDTAVLDSIKKISSAVALLNDKVDSLIMRDDPSKILYVLSDAVDELKSSQEGQDKNILDILSILKSAPDKTLSDKKEEPTAPSGNVRQIRDCLVQLSPGRSYGEPAVITGLQKRVSLDRNQIHRILLAQTDIIKIEDGMIVRV